MLTKPSAPLRPRTTATVNFGRVAVVGTLNVDFIWQVTALPRPGQTILANGRQVEFGGKGANQAVAAARQGAGVTLIGAVGQDAEGERYRAHLRLETIDATWVTVSPDAPTGTAQIYVDVRAENLIIVHRGANEKLDAAGVEAALAEVMAHTDVVTVTLESPLDAALAALRLAARRGIPTVLNASPVNKAFPWGKQQITAVIVNEHECQECFGHPADELTQLSLAARREFLHSKGVEHLIVTQGGEPTLLFGSDTIHSIPTYAVQPRDTVGAGDTFAGVLAARFAEGSGWVTAIRHANIAAALSTLAQGAQTAMPTREAVETAGVRNHSLVH